MKATRSPPLSWPAALPEASLSGFAVLASKMSKRMSQTSSSFRGLRSGILPAFAAFAAFVALAALAAFAPLAVFSLDAALACRVCGGGASLPVLACASGSALPGTRPISARMASTRRSPSSSDALPQAARATNLRGRRARKASSEAWPMLAEDCREASVPSRAVFALKMASSLPAIASSDREAPGPAWPVCSPAADPESGAAQPLLPAPALPAAASWLASLGAGGGRACVSTKSSGILMLRDSKT